MIKWVSIALAVIGVIVAATVALTASSEAPEPPAAESPAINPFDRSIAAAGIVEGASRNVMISAPEPGLAMDVRVEVGEEVREGDVLFRLDTRPLEADLRRARARLDSARAELERLRALPREEEVPIARARVARLEALAADAEDAYTRILQATARDATSDREVIRLRHEMEAANAEAERARAQLELLLDGAWEADVAVGRAEVDAAEAQVSAIENLIDRRLVKAPIAGTVLKRNIEPGEFVSPGRAEPALVIADLSTFVIRAQIHEEDMTDPGDFGEAVARPRGRPEQRIPLEFRRVEPLAIPKRQLTGAQAELVDTRVVEALFEVKSDPDPRLYPGQLVDVFIRVRDE